MSTGATVKSEYDLSVQRAEGEGMVTERAKLSTPHVPPPIPLPTRRPIASAPTTASEPIASKQGQVREPPATHVTSASVVVTYDTAEQARDAGRHLLANPNVPDLTNLVVHTGALLANTVESRYTRARAGAVVGAVVVGIASAIGGAVAASAGILPVSIVVGAIAGLGLGGLYGTIAGGIAGSSELVPRLERLRLRLAQGKAAVTVDVPNGDAARVERALVDEDGSDRAL